MSVPGSRLRQIGWAMVLASCFAIFLALTFKVNAVKSDVALAERQIINLEREKMVLETEFQARASQQQLADWNRIEYGYATPTPAQYVASERDLAPLGLARADGAPDPIRVAKAAPAGEDGLLAMVSPLTGEPLGDDGEEEADGGTRRSDMSAPASLSDRLSRRNPLTSSTTRVSE